MKDLLDLLLHAEAEVGSGGVTGPTGWPKKSREM